jgi:CheY-like chemotaxis protein
MARILVIDDEPLVRATVRMILERHGHDILEAENGIAAVDTDAIWPSDLIITDIIMPEKEGIETIQHFRRTRPSVKIIAMSGGGKLRTDSPLNAARLLGASHVFAKPVSCTDLIHAVDDCLGKFAG